MSLHVVIVELGGGNVVINFLGAFFNVVFFFFFGSIRSI